jgi:Fe-S-cluster-containing dehydrogenase component
MVIDLKKCIGCTGCALVCKVENATPPGIVWLRVIKHETGKYPQVRRVSIPLQCMHCAEPPCMEVCPTGATSKRADGIVTADAEKCVGCRSCMVARPTINASSRKSVTILKTAHALLNKLVISAIR